MWMMARATPVVEAQFAGSLLTLVKMADACVYVGGTIDLNTKVLGDYNRRGVRPGALLHIPWHNGFVNLPIFSRRELVTLSVDLPALPHIRRELYRN